MRVDLSADTGNPLFMQTVDIMHAKNHDERGLSIVLVLKVIKFFLRQFCLPSGCPQLSIQGLRPQVFLILYFESCHVQPMFRWSSHYASKIPLCN
jgi:hypothetical protein